MLRSLINKPYLSQDESKAMNRINKAKERENSEQKYLAQSKKVYPNSITNQENEELNDENYQTQVFNPRPFTTEIRQRQFIGSRQKELRGGTRGMTRQHNKIRKMVMQSTTGQS